MSNEKKTKEEILQTKAPEDAKVFYGRSQYVDIINAMQEFADQELSEKEAELIRLREENKRLRVGRDSAQREYVLTRNALRDLELQLAEQKKVSEGLAEALGMAKELYERGGWRNEIVEQTLLNFKTKQQ